jgi:hypothetical protein
MLQTAEPGNGLPGCRSALGGDPEDLAGERGAVLGQVGLLVGVADGDIQHAVGPEGDPAALVEVAHRDAGQDRLGVLPEVQPGDAVVGVGAVVDVDPAVGGVVGGDRDAQEPALTPRACLGHALHLGDLAGGSDRQDAGGVALGDQRGPVGQERQTPRCAQAGGDGMDRRGGQADLGCGTGLRWVDGLLCAGVVAARPRAGEPAQRPPADPHDGHRHHHTAHHTH